MSVDDEVRKSNEIRASARSRAPSITGKVTRFLLRLDSSTLESRMFSDASFELNASLNLTVVVPDPIEAVGAAWAGEIVSANAHIADEMIY